MSEKRKIHWKLNFFDCAVIVLVILAGGVFYFLSSRSSSAPADAAASGTGTVRYTVELTGMRLEAAELVEVGDTLTEKTQKNTMGEAVSVEITPTEELTKDSINGVYHWVELPERYTATIVVEAQATFTDNEIKTTGGQVVRAGQSVRVNGDGWAGAGYIVAVERSGQSAMVDAGEGSVAE